MRCFLFLILLTRKTRVGKHVHQKIVSCIRNKGRKVTPYFEWKKCVRSTDKTISIFFNNAPRLNFLEVLMNWYGMPDDK